MHIVTLAFLSALLAAFSHNQTGPIAFFLIDLNKLHVVRVGCEELLTFVDVEAVERIPRV